MGLPTMKDLLRKWWPEMFLLEAPPMAWTLQRRFLFFDVSLILFSKGKDTNTGRKFVATCVRTIQSMIKNVKMEERKGVKKEEEAAAAPGADLSLLPVDILLGMDKGRYTTSAKSDLQQKRSADAKKRTFMDGERFGVHFDGRSAFPDNIDDPLEPNWSGLLDDRSLRAVAADWIALAIVKAMIPLLGKHDSISVDSLSTSNDMPYCWTSDAIDVEVSRQEMPLFRNNIGEADFLPQFWLQRMIELQHLSAGCVGVSEPATPMWRAEIYAKDNDHLLFNPIACEVIGPWVQMIWRGGDFTANVVVPGEMMQQLDEHHRALLHPSAPGSLAEDEENGAIVKIRSPEYVDINALHAALCKKLGGITNEWAFAWLILFGGCDLTLKSVNNISAEYLVDTYILYGREIGALVKPPPRALSFGDLILAGVDPKEFRPRVEQPAVWRLIHFAYRRKVFAARSVKVEPKVLEAGILSWDALRSQHNAKKNSPNTMMPTREEIQPSIDRATFALYYFCIYAWLSGRPQEDDQLPLDPPPHLSMDLSKFGYERLCEPNGKVRWTRQAQAPPTVHTY